MALPRIIPALADLTQDIAGPLPVELLQTWAAGGQSAADAERLLDVYRIEGTVVASDTSGLSRLTEERDLLDVLAIVSEPKRILHGLGAAIGGRAIGVWVADNTEMYYPSPVDPALIVGAMAEAQVRIASKAAVGIGMCVHSGEFYEVGGGLYGGDAETVEHLAEACAGPGEILLTRAVTDRLGEATESPFARRPELSAVYAAGVYALVRPGRMAELRADDTQYPHPYPEEFFSLLSGLGQAADAGQIRKRIYDAYLRERVVVFVSKAHEPHSSHNLPEMLDEFVNNALVDTIIKVAMRAEDHVAGLGGGLAILTFDTPAEALEFAQAVRAQFAENGVAVKIGIDRGPVLFFSNPRGPSGIAGDPVNIASKLSEDTGASGKIRITTRAVRGMPVPPGAQLFEISVSRVVLTGVEI
ncbi:MAG: hypothetical protein NTV05_06105 [Acidobacteria bacterium]|nr:hypothetical protein [Acidobacteriota bacterium]